MSCYYLVYIYFSLTKTCGGLVRRLFPIYIFMFGIVIWLMLEINSLLLLLYSGNCWQQEDNGR